MTIHREFRKGQTIIVKLKSGELIEDKYVEAKSKYIQLDSRKVMMKDIKFTSIRKL